MDQVNPLEPSGKHRHSQASELLLQNQASGSLTAKPQSHILSLIGQFRWWDVWYQCAITGRFHCGMSPLRTIQQFGTECGLVSTASPLPASSPTFPGPAASGKLNAYARMVRTGPSAPFCRFLRYSRIEPLVGLAAKPADAARRRRLLWHTKAKINLYWDTSMD
jgi:hypothetical protein